MDVIYTRGGDKGQTSLYSGERVDKFDPLVNAYGTVDELNSAIGVARSHLDKPGKLADILAILQPELMKLMADMARGKPGESKIKDEMVSRMEKWIDELQENMEPLKSFILPGGHPVSAHLHVARTVCRRAERLTISVVDNERAHFDYVVVRYLNRLADLLFILAREANRIYGVDDVKWDGG